MNRSYAAVVWAGKTVVVNEQAAGAVNDRVRVMTFRAVTWARAWQSHLDRRQYDGVEFSPTRMAPRAHRAI
jgi:hypothetical protein